MSVYIPVSSLQGLLSSPGARGCAVRLSPSTCCSLAGSTSSSSHSGGEKWKEGGVCVCVCVCVCVVGGGGGGVVRRGEWREQTREGKRE